MRLINNINSKDYHFPVLEVMALCARYSLNLVIYKQNKDEKYLSIIFSMLELREPVIRFRMNHEIDAQGKEVLALYFMSPSYGNYNAFTYDAPTLGGNDRCCDYANNVMSKLKYLQDVYYFVKSMNECRFKDRLLASKLVEISFAPENELQALVMMEGRCVEHSLDAGMISLMLNIAKEVQRFELFQSRESPRGAPELLTKIQNVFSQIQTRNIERSNNLKRMTFGKLRSEYIHPIIESLFLSIFGSLVGSDNYYFDQILLMFLFLVRSAMIIKRLIDKKCQNENTMSVDLMRTMFGYGKHMKHIDVMLCALAISVNINIIKAVNVDEGAKVEFYKGVTRTGSYCLKDLIAIERSEAWYMLLARMNSPQRTFEEDGNAFWDEMAFAFHSCFRVSWLHLHRLLTYDKYVECIRGIGKDKIVNNNNNTLASNETSRGHTSVSRSKEQSVSYNVESHKKIEYQSITPIRDNSLPYSSRGNNSDTQLVHYDGIGSSGSTRNTSIAKEKFSSVYLNDYHNVGVHWGEDINTESIQEKMKILKVLIERIYDVSRGKSVHNVGLLTTELSTEYERYASIGKAEYEEQQRTKVDVHDYNKVTMKYKLKSTEMHGAYYFKELLAELACETDLSALKNKDQILHAESFYVRTIVANMDLSVLSIAGGKDHCLSYKSPYALRDHILGKLHEHCPGTLTKVAVMLRDLQLANNEDPSGSFMLTLLKCHATLVAQLPEYKFSLDRTVLVSHLPSNLSLHYNLITSNERSKTGLDEDLTPTQFVERLAQCYALNQLSNSGEGAKSHNHNYKKRRAEVNSTNVTGLSSGNDSQINTTQGKPTVTASDRSKTDCYNDPCYYKGCNYNHKEGQQQEPNDAQRAEMKRKKKRK
jgi:hypothetical protein